jgi:prevent-host-death family protein
VRKIAISEFKAKCLAILDEVQKTQEPILITRRGSPIAEVSPPSPRSTSGWIGSMMGRMEILGDIVSPASDPDDLEVLRD